MEKVFRQLHFRCGEGICLAMMELNACMELTISVKETMNWRYCWRAGVMSRNEGGEEEGLLVLMVFLREKAHFLLRATAVRRGHVCL